MGKMKEIGLLDCEDRPSIEENFERVVKSNTGGGGADVLNENGKLKNEVLPEGYPYEEEAQVLILENESMSEGPATGAKEGYGEYLSGDQWALKVSAMVVGDTYTVTVDGVDYTGVCKYYADSSSDGGNGIELFNDDFSEAPVSLGSYSNILYISFEGSDPYNPVLHSVKIYHHATTIVPMAEKFLPDYAEGKVF